MHRSRLGSGGGQCCCVRVQQNSAFAMAQMTKGSNAFSPFRHGTHSMLKLIMTNENETEQSLSAQRSLPPRVFCGAAFLQFCDGRLHSAHRVRFGAPFCLVFALKVTRNSIVTDAYCTLHMPRPAGRRGWAAAALDAFKHPLAARFALKMIMHIRSQQYLIQIAFHLNADVINFS